MAWTLYKNWSGNVIGARVRVPATLPTGIACFGPSLSPIALRPGAIGTIRNILPPGASRPPYIRFAGPFDLAFAAEVLVRRAENSPVTWADFANVHIGDEATVVIPRRVLDTLEVEFAAK